MRSFLVGRIQAGFTLVELLIVVIILAVLAAIIVPQFSSATKDAELAALDANLARLRAAIELYQAQHGGKYPGDNPSNGGTCTTNKGTGSGGSGPGGAQAFMDQLLKYSDRDGNACGVGDTTTYKYGPYVRKGIPTDSTTGKGSKGDEIVVTNIGAPISPQTTTGGWAYDTKSGQFVMNSNADDGKGKKYYEH
jgi:prepilin-type N-terminal cleavage/methylation domain-containing protein